VSRTRIEAWIGWPEDKETGKMFGSELGRSARLPVVAKFLPIAFILGAWVCQAQEAGVPSMAAPRTTALRKVLANNEQPPDTLADAAKFNKLSLLYATGIGAAIVVGWFVWARIL
jgi:hypothetical protein